MSSGRRSRNRRNGVPGREIAALWGASAGRCNICNTSLLVDATTGLAVKAGEMAHIVGISDGPRSPRGQSALTRAERDRAENLILLCEKHHTEVDERVDNYTVERLRSLKSEFEARVFYLTSLDHDRKTLVLRMVGTIHGVKVPDVTREEAREIVLREEGRYPRFDLSSTAQDASIDLRTLTGEGTSEYWSQADGQIERVLQLLGNMETTGGSGHVSVFGIARIPALVLLGNRLGDARNATIYHRRNQEGWGWNAQAQLPKFEIVEHQSRAKGSSATLACSLTAEVQLDRAPEDVLGCAVYEIRPTTPSPGHTLLDHPEALRAFITTYREFLTMMESTRTLNLLPAVPADAAIALGQVRTPAVSPTLRVYDLNRQSGAYEFACEMPGRAARSRAATRR